MPSAEKYTTNLKIPAHRSQMILQKTDKQPIPLPDETTFFPKINTTIDRTKKTKNKILAISIADPAIPPKPKIAATSAIIKNVTA